MSAYLQIRDDIRNCAVKCGRNPEEIRLVVVTKNHPLEEALIAYDAGCRDFGENRVQEALDKFENAPADIRWHLIGTLQKKKVSKVIGKFALIHSIDSFELAEKISQASLNAGTTTNILLQVNVSGELSKHGLSIEDWRLYVDKLFALPSLRIEGLMTMAPLTDDKELIRYTFSRLRHFRDEVQRIFGIALPHLSMGMSHDYEIAIEEGATLLRIGTAIFENF